MTTSLIRAFGVASAIVIASGAVRAQQRPPAQQPPPQQQPPAAEKPAGAAPAAPAQPAATGGGYTYDPQGRRDPFINLLGRGTDASTANRPSGLAGVLIGETVITAIIRSRSGFTAFLRGPDNKTYIVKGGERLMDGTVKSINEGVVVFSQDVNDPLSLVKQREIRKTARPGGGSQE